MLKSKTLFPPGGFWYYQAEMDWPKLNPKTFFRGMTLRQVVSEVIRVRAANPRFGLSLDPVSVEKDVMRCVCIGLNWDSKYCIDTGDVGKSDGLSASPQRIGQSAVEGAAGEGGGYLRNTAAGIGLYVEWFGEGNPVSRVEAERRAGICVNCPYMVKGNIAQRFNAVAAKQIMQVFGILHSLKLKTDKDDQLQICDLCDCPLKAKVWSPLELVQKHLVPETGDLLPMYCWIRGA